MRTTDTQTALQPVDAIEFRKILHELANLFTAILITSGLLRSGGREPERVEKYSRELLTSGERGAALVREARCMLIPAKELVASGRSVTVKSDASHAEQPAKQSAKSARGSRARSLQ